MRVLLDEDMLHQLRDAIPEHELVTVHYAGWAGKKNGASLGMATEAGFGAFVTCDRGFEHQQNIPALGLAVIVLAGKNLQFETIEPLIPNLREMLDADPRPGTLTVVGTSRR